jgi:hypothetical protein
MCKCSKCNKDILDLCGEKCSMWKRGGECHITFPCSDCIEKLEERVNQLEKLQQEQKERTNKLEKSKIIRSPFVPRFGALDGLVACQDINIPKYSTQLDKFVYIEKTDSF